MHRFVVTVFEVETHVLASLLLLLAPKVSPSYLIFLFAKYKQSMTATINLHYCTFTRFKAHCRSYLLKQISTKDFTYFLFRFCSET